MTNVVPAKPLDVRQIAFIDEYMRNGRNATQAAIACGYSAKSASRQGTRMSTNVRVREELDRRIALYSKTAGIDVVWVLERYKRHIEARLSDLFDDQGVLLPPKQWPEHMQDVVQSVKVQEMAGGMGVTAGGGPVNVPMYTKDVRLEAKLPALAKLMDFTQGVIIPPEAPKTQVNVNLDMRDVMEQVRARLRQGG